MGIKEKIERKRVYLDTNIFIYIFEGYSEYRKNLIELLEAIEKETTQIFTSELTIGELLIFPLQKNDYHTVDKYNTMMNDHSFVSLIPTSQKIHKDAAAIVALSREKYPDAIHIASAIYNRCDVFITNDKRIKNRNDIEILQLSCL